MAETLDYSDYHRTVIAYHGTSAAAAARLVAGEDFEASDRDNEWFGKGIYFWEHAYKQAWHWARVNKKYARPAVVGAVIRLGNCFDLVDPVNVEVLRGFHDELLTQYTSKKTRVPANVLSNKRLDCAVFNFVYARFEKAGTPLDTARAVYVPTTSARRVYKGSWISEETHIQVCIRTPRSILAVWHVREDGRYGTARPGQSRG